MLLLALSSPNFAFPQLVAPPSQEIASAMAACYWCLLQVVLIPEVTCLNLTMPVFKQSCSESSKLAPGPQQRIVSVSLKSIFAKQRGASFELQKDCLKNLHGRRGFAVSCRESLRLYSCMSEAPMWSDSKQTCTSPAFIMHACKF